MTLYLKNGSQFSVTNKADLDIYESLPVGTYTVGFDPNRGFYLIQVDNFSITGKVYGDTLKTADRILNTFADRSGSTGVLLSGDKGSGKTLLAKKISLQAAEQDIPTLVINNPLAGESFNTFMQTIDQPLIVVFDEFEKVYDSSDQEKLLTLFDGVYTSKKLFILTSNDPYRIDRHMQNRPGRIFYSKSFGGLEPEFIKEYCEDNLNNKDNIESVVRVAMLFGKFNFDTLKALVEEMNRYNETAQESLELLNAQPSSNTATQFNAELTINGTLITLEQMGGSNTVEVNPLYSNFDVNYRIEVPKEDSVDAMFAPWEDAYFQPEHLTDVDVANGRFSYDNTDGATLVLTRAVANTTPKWHEYMA
jgi:hypothetical protein